LEGPAAVRRSAISATSLQGKIGRRFFHLDIASTRLKKGKKVENEKAILITKRSERVEIPRQPAPCLSRKGAHRKRRRIRLYQSPGLKKGKVPRRVQKRSRVLGRTWEGCLPSKGTEGIGKLKSKESVCRVINQTKGAQERLSNGLIQKRKSFAASQEREGPYTGNRKGTSRAAFHMRGEGGVGERKVFFGLYRAQRGLEGRKDADCGGSDGVGYIEEGTTSRGE